MSCSIFHADTTVEVLYSEKDNKRRKNLFYWQIFFMKFVGQLPLVWERPALPNWQLKAAKYFSRFYGVFTAVSNLHLALLFIKTTYDMLQVGELEEITDALTMAIIFTFSAYATCYWQWKSKLLSSFLKDINEQHYHHSMPGLTFVNTETAYKLAHKMTLYWLRCCWCGVVSWALNPLLLGLHTLPLKCWYPFDALQPVAYELVYTTQVWCQFLMGCIFGSGSALFVSIIIIILGQFDILYCSLKNINYHAQLKTGVAVKHLEKLQTELLPSEEDELNQYAFSQEYRTDLKRLALKFTPTQQSYEQVLHNSLIECVQLHRFILKSCATLEKLFNPYCLVKSLQITLQLCLLVFVGVAGQSSTMRIINLLQYLVLTLVELFMFTYFGELLKSHSTRGGEAFFRSSWWPPAHTIKRDIFIFLINTRHAVKLTAGKFYLMDVQRLRSVIAEAFSFLTLLQKLAEKNK